MQSSSPRASCGCLLIVLIINITIGALSFAYCLSSIFGKVAPWIVNVVAGLFLGEITIPVSVILLIAHWCGVVFPLFK